MIIYCGSSNVDEAKSLIRPESLLYQSKSVLVAADRLPLKIPIDENKTIFVWGTPYAVKQSDGYYNSLDASSSSASLRELFGTYDVAEAVKRLEGDFIAVLIEHNNRIAVFSDMFNRTEVFYSMNDEGAVISTTLEPVIKSVGAVSYLPAAIANLLSIYGCYAPKKQTIYNKVNRLGVGEFLIYDNSIVRIERTEFAPVSSRPFGERELRQYTDILEDAVRIRSSEKCNWVFLSSGWDSTSILALLIKIHGPQKIRCVIGEMKYSKRAGTINQFEIDRAKKVADYFKVRLDVVPLDICSQEAVDYLKTICADLRERHIYSFVAYNFFRLTDFVLSQGSSEDAVFSGEFSDGAHNLGFSQFATILEHPDLGFREYSDKMASYLFGPSFFKRVLDGTYDKDFVYNILKGRFASSFFDDALKLSEKDRRRKYFASFFVRSTRIPFFSSYNGQMLTKKGSDMLEEEVYEMYLKDAAQSALPETLYSWILHLYNSFYWQGSNIRSMGAKLEISGAKLRIPFGDNRMLGFLSEMPENWGRGLELRPTKYPLKWMLENRVDYPLHLQTGPHSYLYDVNPNFSHASEILFGSFLSLYFKDLLAGYPYESLLKDEYFDLAYLRKIVDNYRKGIEFAGPERSDLLSLVTLCLIGWY
mgnify:FL=1